MTDDEFIRTYHDYATEDHEAAVRESLSIRLEDGSHPVVVELQFPNSVQYCLMLPGAADWLRNLYE